MVLADRPTGEEDEDCLYSASKSSAVRVAALVNRIAGKGRAPLTRVVAEAWCLRSHHTPVVVVDGRTLKARSTVAKASHPPPRHSCRGADVGRMNGALRLRNSPFHPPPPQEWGGSSPIAPPAEHKEPRHSCCGADVGDNERRLALPPFAFSSSATTGVWWLPTHRSARRQAGKWPQMRQRSRPDEDFLTSREFFSCGSDRFG